ncbi:G-type lectin S-receptor-like serine/threonine-kinase [Actinidia rufa]|uniref:G-type lectin S-receptor-like serine/threonine-kinase n=1 Tax=Actinidia rufa TaxID=165716 RepID=A0A7J0EPD0_9ERIC|nr:G-type lectin S-receptor-like serine/threonine-kinase [Actinidia rufa]
MDENLKLTSWSSENDPRSGNFTFQQDQGSENSYKIMNRSLIYWTSRATGSFKPDPLYIPMALLLINSTGNTTDKSSHKTKNISSNFEHVRLLMNSSGEFQYYTLDKNKQWSLRRSEPQDSCSVYGACGDFGVCNSKNLVPCKCLPGFEPASLNKWKRGDFSRGCKRKLEVCVNDKETETFLDVKMMKVGIPQSLYPKADKKQKCQAECLSNCRCQAYSYNDANYQRQRGSGIKGCWIWAMPPNSLQEEYAEDGYNISVRVVASSIGSTARECKPCGTNVIPYPLSTGKKLCKEHCEARNSIAKGLQLAPSSPFKVLNLCYAEPGSTRSEMQQRNMDEVEFGWNPPPEPLCNSSAECKDWPNSSCNATVGVTGRCQCNRNYRWDEESINCTKDVCIIKLYNCPSISESRQGSQALQRIADGNLTLSDENGTSYFSVSFGSSSSSPKDCDAFRFWELGPNSLQEEYAEDGYNISVRVVTSSIGSPKKMEEQNSKTSTCPDTALYREGGASILYNGGRLQGAAAAKEGAALQTFGEGATFKDSGATSI